MKKNPILKRLETELDAARKAGTYKRLRPLESPIGAQAKMQNIGQVLVMSSNDYLGFSNHPQIVAAAKKALDMYGASTASVRFICGTLAVHDELEHLLAQLHGTEAAMTYSSCWAANTGLTPAITVPGDVVISDALNHASIIDGCRMVAKGVVREVYQHADMNDLERLLKQHQDAPGRVVITDGVFSMEGDLAPLDKIAELCQRYSALLVLDDSHGLGVVGRTGKGVAELYNVMDQIDVYTGTLGKALGAGTGGFVAGPRAVTEMLVQRSRPHLFSNALPASVAGAGVASLELLRAHPEKPQSLMKKAAHLREAFRKRGIESLEGQSAIVPVILGETARAIAVAERMLARHIFVTGFGFPVVPEGHARLRFQVSDAHSYEQLDQAADALSECLQEAKEGAAVAAAR